MKKGFTLVELLAVIIIIAVLAIIILPSYIDMSDSVKNSNLESIKKMVANTMVNYANREYMDQIKPSGNTCNNSTYKCCAYFSIAFIKSHGIFKTTNSSIINPVTNQDLDGYIKVTYDRNKLLLTGDYTTSINPSDSCIMCAVVNGNTEVIKRCDE